MCQTTKLDNLGETIRGQSLVVRTAAARFTLARSPARIVKKGAVGATPGVGLVADPLVRQAFFAVPVIKGNHAVSSEGGTEGDHPYIKYHFEKKGKSTNANQYCIQKYECWQWMKITELNCGTFFKKH
jgi:hypothetical protein